MNELKLTTKEIEDSQYFIKGAKKPELLVLVEDELDIPFWKKMFECVNDKYFRIHIHSLKTAPRQTKKDSTPLAATGKDSLMNINPDTLGKSKIIAVDADYDLIIDDYHQYTSRLREGKYIVHTAYYAIENHLINKNTLQTLDIWKRLGSEKVQRSWEDILTSFRDAVCHSVKLCIASNSHRIPELKAENQQSQILLIRTLHSEVNKLSFNPTTYERDNTNWKTLIEATYSEIENICSKELAEVEKKISDKDVLNCIQGHTLYDYIKKVVKYFFEVDYKKLENNCKNDLKLKGNNVAIGEAIANLKSNVYGTSRNCINCISESIYNANALDMSEIGIVNIQNQIKSICK